MQFKEQKSKEYFNGLLIIYTSIIIGQILVGFILYFFNLKIHFISEGKDLNEIFQIITPLFILGGLIWSILFMRIQRKKIKGKIELKEKLQNFRYALVIKSVLLGFPSIFSIFCYFQTDNYFFLLLAGIGIIISLVNIPTRSKITNYKFSAEDGSASG